MKPLTVFCSLLNVLRLTRRTPHHHRHHSPQNPRLTSYICVPLFFFLAHRYGDDDKEQQTTTTRRRRIKLVDGKKRWPQFIYFYFHSLHYCFWFCIPSPIYTKHTPKNISKKKNDKPHDTPSKKKSHHPPLISLMTAARRKQINFCHHKCCDTFRSMGRWGIISIKDYISWISNHRHQ